MLRLGLTALSADSTSVGRRVLTRLCPAGALYSGLVPTTSNQGQTDVARRFRV